MVHFSLLSNSLCEASPNIDVYISSLKEKRRKKGVEFDSFVSLYVLYSLLLRTEASSL